MTTVTVNFNNKRVQNAVLDLCNQLGVSYQIAKPVAATRTRRARLHQIAMDKTETISEAESFLIAHLKQNIDKILDPATSMTMEELYAALEND